MCLRERESDKERPKKGKRTVIERKGRKRDMSNREREREREKERDIYMSNRERERVVWAMPGNAFIPIGLWDSS